MCKRAMIIAVAPKSEFHAHIHTHTRTHIDSNHTTKYERKRLRKRRTHTLQYMVNVLVSVWRGVRTKITRSIKAFECWSLLHLARAHQIISCRHRRNRLNRNEQIKLEIMYS